MIYFGAPGECTHMPPQSPSSLVRGLPLDAVKSLWRRTLTSVVHRNAESVLDGAHYDYVVVGAGVHGSATAAELASRGQRVLLVEQFDWLHRRGSSHGESRITRSTYPQTHYTQMMKKSFLCWEQACNAYGSSCFTLTGGLDFAMAGNPAITALIKSAAENGVPHEVLTPQDVAARFPAYSLPEGCTAVYHPQAGVLAATKAVAMFQSLCRQRGGVLVDRTAVLSMHATSGGVEVRTSKGNVTAERCVIAAGAWTSGLLRSSFGCDLSRVLTAVPVAVSYWRCKDAASAEQLSARNCPVSIFYTGAGLGNADSHGADAEMYTTPVLEMPGLVKISLHLPEHLWGALVIGDPSARLVVPPEEVVRHHVTSFVATHFPGVDSSRGPALIEPCMYTMTPDHSFIIDTVPNSHGRCWLVSACSGHGFKFGALIGQVMADLAITGTTDAAPVDEFRLARFSDLQIDALPSRL